MGFVSWDSCGGVVLLGWVDSSLERLRPNPKKALSDVLLVWWVMGAGGANDSAV